MLLGSLLWIGRRLGHALSVPFGAMSRLFRWPVSLACTVWLTIALTLTFISIEMLVDLDVSLGADQSSQQPPEHFAGDDETVNARWIPVQIQPHKEDDRNDENQLPVYVIEEHHEALTYWFKAANEGRIPKHGNILIHIDGHSDEESPELKRGMPFFRYPENDKEITFLMQQNDVFIRAAVMSRLISRVVWIWPKWDRSMLAEQHATSVDARTVELGWFLARLGGGTIQPYLCSCEKIDTTISDFGVLNRTGNDMSGVKGRKCTYLTSSDDSSDEDGQEEVDLNPDQCRIMTSYQSVHLSEVTALEQLSASSSSSSSSIAWLDDAVASGAGIILDIDEDFFGCEVPSDWLAQAKSDASRNKPSAISDDDDDDRIPRLSWHDVEALDSAIAEFVCPRDVDGEDQADRLLRNLINGLLAFCSRDVTEDGGGGEQAPTGNASTTASADCSRKITLDELLNSVDNVLGDALIQTPWLFCSDDDTSARNAWLRTAMRVLRIPIHYLRRIVESVGFCLNTAPRTFNFRREPGIGDMAVCHGANEPNSPLVFHYRPNSTAELDDHLSTFDQLLSAFRARLDALKDASEGRSRSRVRNLPGVVTLCRSVRDGYTPRSMASRIETRLLETIKNRLGQRPKTDVRIVFDKDLLAGESGWVGRVDMHKVSGRKVEKSVTN